MSSWIKPLPFPWSCPMAPFQLQTHIQLQKSPSIGGGSLEWRRVPWVKVDTSREGGYLIWMRSPWGGGRALKVVEPSKRRSTQRRPDGILAAQRRPGGSLAQKRKETPTPKEAQGQVQRLVFRCLQLQNMGAGDDDTMHGYHIGWYIRIVRLDCSIRKYTIQ